MRTSRKLTTALLALCALVVMGTATFAADPGVTYPTASEVSDQKAGSVLVYNFYSSNPASANTQNTRFNITNTSTTSASFVHLFFVDGGTCSVSDRYICLTANQTLTFLASEQDPGTTGYLVAVATDGTFGCPISFNHLIGDEYVKLELGHQANLGAEAFSALYDDAFGGAILPGCDGTVTTAALVFNGTATGYNRWPRVVAVSSIPPINDGNDTRLIVVRGSGSLVSGAASTVSLFGILYNDQEEPHSWTSTVSCQFVRRLDNNFPRTTPRFDQVIPAGQSGWTKFWVSSGDVGLLGSVINHNANAGTAAGAFRGGRNLHKLTLSATNTYTIPVFPPAC